MPSVADVVDQLLLQTPDVIGRQFRVPGNRKKVRCVLAFAW